MECLRAEDIQSYLEGELSPIRAGMARDHLLTCERCRQAHAFYQSLNRELAKPDLRQPPQRIITGVMSKLFPRLPFYSSVAAFIGVGFVFMITWIYVYFDFAHNSLVRAYQLTAQQTSGWAQDLIRSASSVFSAVYAAFKAINSFLEVLLKMRIGVGIIGTTALALSLMLFYTLIVFSQRLFKEKQK